MKNFDTKEIMPFVKNAVPSVIQQSIPAISTTFLTAIVSTYSISAIAGYGVAGKLEMILFYPAMALNMVLTSIVGQCIGAQRIDRAKNYLKLALLLFQVYYQQLLFSSLNSWQNCLFPT